MSTTPQAVEGSKPQIFYGTGRRKESVARVYVTAGTGKFTVNGRPVEEYFNNVAWRNAALEPLKFTNTADQVDVTAMCKAAAWADSLARCAWGFLARWR